MRGPAPATERRRYAGRLLAAASVVLLAGCGGTATTASPPGPSTVATGRAGSPQAAGAAPAGRPVEAQRRRAEQRLLDERAAAVRAGDEAAFLDGVAPGDAALVARQRRYFRNLVQLPLARFDYRVGSGQWADQPVDPGAGAARPGLRGVEVRVPQVTLRLQLDGFDAVPVRTTVGFAFAFRDGSATIVADRDSEGRPWALGPTDPWDLTAVTVRRAPGVLGVFDARTRPTAATVVAAVSEGIEQVRSALPFAMPGRVVVYSVADRGVLRSFTEVPGGSLDHLGALTFPAYADTSHRRTASVRMLLLPGSVAAGQPFLGRIVRHELTHVALGARDDGTPTWVSEGVAEYVGARPVPEGRRIIATQAPERARRLLAGEEHGLPSSGDFNGADQEWNYALSWMAMDQLAATAGEDRVWELVEAMHNGGLGTTDAEQDRVLEQVLGFDGDELARRAAARIVAIYR